MDFEPNFKVHNLVSVYPKSIKLSQMTNLNMIFHVVVSVYQLVKIWNSPQFPAEFRNSLYIAGLTPSTKFTATLLYTWVDSERHWEGKVSYPRTQHNVSRQGLNPTAWSRGKYTNY